MSNDLQLNSFRSGLFGLKGKAFLLFKLPLAYIAGVRPLSLDNEQCSTKIKFRWINKNPFRSLYFAAMHMAAELSSGLLLFQYLNSGYDFSMLLVKTEATYSKKAVGLITCSCHQANEVKDVITSLTDESLIPLHVIAKNEVGETVAEFTYYWSIKKRPRR